MAAAYTKEFLVNAFLHRYRSLPESTVYKLRHMAEKTYDEVGRDKFRVYASVTPEEIREYKSAL
jgi:hypothetical protein